MKRLLSKLGAALPIVMALTVMTPGTANAATVASGAVTGSGTITPGLTPLALAYQSFTFSGAFTGQIGGTNPYVGFTCTINAAGASDIPESQAVGAGHGSATCTGNSVLGGSFTLSCGFLYFRAGSQVQIMPPPGLTGCEGHFVFVPTTTNPTTTFDLVGRASLVAS